MSRLKSQITRVAKNKDAKTVAGNFMWLSALQVAGYIFPLITMPYLARVIGVEGFGKIAFATAIMGWIQTIADWGFNFTATRDVAQNKDNQQKISEIFSNVLWARCFLTLLAFLVLLSLILVVPKFKEESAVILVTFLMIPGHIFFPDWFFQAIEKMKYITIFNMLMKLMFTIAVFVFIKDSEDYILQPLFTSLGYVVCGIMALYLIIGKWKIRLLKPKWNSILHTIKGSTDVFINNLAPNLYNSFSVMLLGFYGGGIGNGIYDGGNRFFTFCNSILLVVSRAFFPFLSRKPDNHRTFTGIILTVAILMSVTLYLCAPWLIDVMLSSEFCDSVLVLRILAVSLIFLALSTAYGNCYLIIIHKTQLLRRVTIISSLVGFVIAWPLVFHFSYIGAACTVVVTRMILAILTYLAAKGLIFRNQ